MLELRLISRQHLRDSGNVCVIKLNTLNGYVKSSSQRHISYLGNDGFVLADVGSDFARLPMFSVSTPAGPVDANVKLAASVMDRTFKVASDLCRFCRSNGLGAFNLCRVYGYFADEFTQLADGGGAYHMALLFRLEKLE